MNIVKSTSRFLLPVLTLIAFDQFAQALAHLVGALVADPETKVYLIGFSGLFLIVVSAIGLYAAREQIEIWLGMAFNPRPKSLVDDSMTPPTEHRSRFRYELGATVAVLGLATGADWLCQAVQLGGDWIVAVSCLIFVLGLFSLNFSHNSAKFRVRGQGTAGDCDTLIMFLSNNVYVENGSHRLEAHAPNNPPSEADLTAAFAPPAGSPQTPMYDSWLMPMLSIRHQIAQKGKLKNVLLIPSTTSVTQIDAFKNLVHAWFGKDLNLENICEHGADYTNLKELWDIVNNKYAQLQNRKDKVIVDVTAGKLTCSIAGAIATFPPGRLFKYVDTQPPHTQHAFVIAYGPDNSGSAA